MNTKRAFTILALYAVMQLAPGVAQAQTQEVLLDRLAALEASLAKERTNITNLRAAVVNLSAAVTVLGVVTNCMSVEGNDVFFTGCNVHIRNGLGLTESTNGLGNLIVGYNEGDRDRAGSHNLVVGPSHTYTSYGGFVAGQGNSVTAGGASVSGGAVNTASGLGASVSGGTNNTASGSGASVSGGFQNTATGVRASVSGGGSRSALGTDDWAAGGLFQGF